MSVPQTDTETPPYATATIHRHVEWVDTDAAGHHHNSAILRWVEACEAELSHDLGLDDYFPSAPRVHQTVDFTSRLSFGQEVTTTVAIRKIGRTSLTLDFEVFGEAFGGQDRIAAAHGFLVTVHMAPAGDHATPWPQATIDAIREPHHPPTAHHETNKENH